MMPDFETHAHHHAHDAPRHWLDWVLPVSALFVSVVSLALAVIHGQAMERMAEANARLVSANSWPLLQYTTGNISDNGDLDISLRIQNQGVGPAKVEWLEVYWEGKPVRDDVELLKICCGLDSDAFRKSQAVRGSTVEEKIANAKAAAKSSIRSDLPGVGGRGVLQAKQQGSFLTLGFTPDTAPVWQRLNTARMKVRLRGCYCSVFDECWISDMRTLHPTPVKVCPAPRSPFRG